MSPDERDDVGMAATPHDQLIAELLDSRIPKNEHGHAAEREIRRLLRYVDELRAAAGKVECDHCGRGVAAPDDDGIPINCPDCDELRALLTPPPAPGPGE